MKEDEEQRALLEAQFDNMRVDAWRSGEWNTNLEDDILGEDGSIVLQPYAVTFHEKSHS